MMKVDKNFQQQALKSVKQLWHTYLNAKEPQKLAGILANLPPDLVLFGTGKHELYDNLAAALKGLDADLSKGKDIILDIVDEWYDVQQLTDDVCIVYGTFWVREQAPATQRVLVDMDTRFTVACRRQGQGVQICNIHHSVPNTDQQHGEYYPKTITQKANEAFQRLDFLEERLHTDALTGLFSRTYIESRADERLQKGQGHCAFFMIDLDDFKEINDTLGHLGGDRVLRTFAATLRAVFRQEDWICRLGGDEFAVLMLDIPSPQKAEERAGELLERVRAKSRADGSGVSCTIGLSFAPEDGVSFQELYRKADLALYTAKKHHKGEYCIYHYGLE